MGRSLINDPLLKCNYTVTIPGLPTGLGFQKVSGLSRSINVTEYNEGGSKATRKIPGREKVEDVTLERGVYASKELEEYYKKALTSPEFRQTVTISLNDRLGNVQKTWTLAECWCSKWENTDMDSGSDDVGIEKITLTFEYFID